MPDPLTIKPKILYRIAKAAWEGTLTAECDEICRLIHEEYKDTVSRSNIANQIRFAMGLPPAQSDAVLPEGEAEALMGMEIDHFIVANPEACRDCGHGERACEKACLFHAIGRDAAGKLTIDYEKCLEEGHCVAACSFGALAEKSQFIPLIQLLRQRKTPLIASVAPAFAGQFGPDATFGKLRAALLKIGFADAVETALYADLVTMKEAFEFDAHVHGDDDFLLTSCCCPVWIKLIENKYPELIEHISPSVSPMIASGRIIKHFNPTAKVVFIGPCIAKKSEIRLPGLAGAIDFVLTFQELDTLLAAAEVRPAQMEEDGAGQASWSGRVYAHTGGVSAAVRETLRKIRPRHHAELRPVCVDGIPACQAALAKIAGGGPEGNFIEGMACQGGCIGGPGRIVGPAASKPRVQAHGDAADMKTPVENPAVYAILHGLSGESVCPLTGEGYVASLLSRQIGPPAVNSPQP